MWISILGGFILIFKLNVLTYLKIPSNNQENNIENFPSVVYKPIFVPENSVIFSYNINKQLKMKFLGKCLNLKDVTDKNKIILL